MKSIASIIKSTFRYHAFWYEVAEATTVVLTIPTIVAIYQLLLMIFNNVFDAQRILMRVTLLLITTLAASCAFNYRKELSETTVNASLAIYYFFAGVISGVILAVYLVVIAASVLITVLS